MLLQKEEKNLNYCLKGEWDSKICMDLIVMIRIFFLSHLGQERFVSVMPYFQLVPTRFRFLHLVEDFGVGNNEEVSRKERQWGPYFQSSWTTRSKGKVICRNYLCCVLERLVFPGKEVMLKVTLLMLYVEEKCSVTVDKLKMNNMKNILKCE